MSCAPPGWPVPQAPPRRRRARARPGHAAATRGGTCCRRWPRASPALVVLEDAHWAEPALLDLVESLHRTATRGAAGGPVPGARRAAACAPGLGVGHRDNATVVTLGRHRGREMRRLADALPAGEQGTAGSSWPAATRSSWRRSWRWRRGRRAVVPETVQGVISARLDLLPAERSRLLQRAAVIGRTFSRSSWPRSSGRPRARRSRRLSRRDLLVAAGLGWAFKHALIRDVAYESHARAASGHGCTSRSPAGSRPHPVREPAGDRQPLRIGRRPGSRRGPCRCRAAAAGRRVRRPLGVRPRARAAPGRAGPVACRRRPRAVARGRGGRRRLLDGRAAGGGISMPTAQALDHADRAGLGETTWPGCGGSGSTCRRAGAVLPICRRRPAREAIEAGDRGRPAPARRRGGGSAGAPAGGARAHRLALRVERPAAGGGPVGRTRRLRSREGLGGRSLISAALDAQAGCSCWRCAASGSAGRRVERRMSLIPVSPHARSRWTSARRRRRTRIAVGDYAGAVAAADLADELVAGGDRRWVGLARRARGWRRSSTGTGGTRPCAPTTGSLRCSARTARAAG